MPLKAVLITFTNLHKIKVVGMKSLKTIIQFTLKLEWERDVF